MNFQEEKDLDSLGKGSSAYNALYRKLNHTFRSQYDAYVYGDWGICSAQQSPRHRVPEEAKKDQRMIQTLKQRLGDAAVFYAGDSKALYQKYYVHLDPDDYRRAATLSGTDLCIPAPFARRILEEKIDDEDGYVNLSAFCRENREYTLFHYGKSKLYVLLPMGVDPFSDLEKVYPDIDIRVDSTYTERQFLDRLVQFYTDPIFPEDVICDAERTRTVIAHYPYPTDLPDFSGFCFTDTASPSIIVTGDGGNRVYWVSHEKTLIIKGVPNQPEESKTETLLWRRSEKETVWTYMGSVDEMRWGSVFSANGKIYLLGSVRCKFHVQIAELLKEGEFKTAILFPSECGCGPNGSNAILHANGRIYKAYNKKILSALNDADLLDPESWTASQNIEEVITLDWLRSATGVMNLPYVCIEEGEMVQKGESLFVMYRLNHELAPLNHMILAEVYWESGVMKLRNPQYINIPTTLTKIGIKYDEISCRFYAITATKHVSHDSARMNLVLLYSPDLVHWENAGNILVEREMMNPYLSAQAHGYNYADFIIDGNDIHLVVREASGDDAQWWHEGNYLTLYTVKNFRGLIKSN